MRLFYLEEVDSTNKYAKSNIDDIADGTIIYTYNQTSGRGRLNRKWTNIGSDNIYASIVLKPSARMLDVYSNLTQFLCLILAQTFEEYGVVPKIKWPNDILINGKKISGILAESVMEKDLLKGLVLGFGVNLNSTKEILEKIEQPATSLNIETEQYIDKEFFMQKLISRFCLLYNDFIEEGFILIRDDYLRRVSFINDEVAIKVFDKVYNGLLVDITENGALKLKDKNNNIHTLLIGDIL